MSERGSGSILAVAVLAGIVTAVALFFPLLAVVGVRARMMTAADSAALAAADVATGLLPGVPCDEAGRVATANGATLASCVVDGLVVTVSVHRRFTGILIAASATAGPPTVGVG